ncbi:MAG: hypothetical protein JKY52_08475 [Flavobacteriales bacterium]|nr:hypothetical protein [Flavobacteriales bacterium]
MKDDLRFRDVVWKMKDGDTIKVRDMKDSHLANTVSMIDRKLTRMGGKVADVCSYMDGNALLGIEINDALDRASDKMAAYSHATKAMKSEIKHRESNDIVPTSPHIR